MSSKLRYWIPLAITITSIYASLYVLFQQNLRLGANEFSLSFSKDLSNLLASPQTVKSTPLPYQIDLAKSDSAFVILYDSSGKVERSTALIDGKTPDLPQGVLEYTKTHSVNTLTWQPQRGVREAITVRKINRNNGFVLVGRSLAEVEARISQLTTYILIAWVGTLLLTAGVVAVVIPSSHKKK
jgi:hypothetical protein